MLRATAGGSPQACMCSGRGRGERSMSSGWQRYLDLAAGLGETTRKSADAVVRKLVASGEVASDRAEDYVEELLKASERNGRTVASMVRTETERTIGRLGFVRQAEVERLRARVEELEGQRATDTTASPGASGDSGDSTGQSSTQAEGT